ncbi:hypothetical protein QYF50_07275 [Paenibacillus vini]|uniref:hypothetical protein n=1 Tax=Paenibacillus vini TaxID=1476024 RepID=UPI0025B734F5|nr:hypothetical protein [Paenibacillus vini]MDN4067693.1 hypothetical protein [Paenibacillus vini]
MQDGKQFSLYVLNIIDDGIITIPDLNIFRLIEQAKAVIPTYLSKHGYRDEEGSELKTEDGYAKIIYVNLACSNEEQTIWQYNFDGEELIEHAIQRLVDQAKLMNLIGASNGYFESSMYHYAFINSSTDQVLDVRCGSEAASKALKELQESNKTAMEIEVRPIMLSSDYLSKPLDYRGEEEGEPWLLYMTISGETTYGPVILLEHWGELSINIQQYSLVPLGI